MNSRSDPPGAWRDLGRVFRGDGRRPWMHSHGYVPTACLLPDRIRVFTAFWDTAQIGRIGYVDVARDDPSAVLGFSPDPVLDTGVPGSFDADGVTPMAVVRDGTALRLYYAGWARCPQVRYRLFTGLAISHDDGAGFTRYDTAPVIGPAGAHGLVRTGFIAKDGPVWKAWLAQSGGTIDIAGKQVPAYDLGYAESPDGLAWPAPAALCLAQGRDGVFGYGRSAVWRGASGFHAMLSVRRRSGYRIEYTHSPDGIGWDVPGTGGFALLPGAAGQAETMFPSVVDAGSRRFAFYNGDGFGRDGVRCAEWVGDAR